MGKLLERMMDPARSGVYRVTRADEVVDALRGSKLASATVDLQRPVFEAFAEALAFPEWFGRNWDALEDCLTDLSWQAAAGHVILLQGGDDPGILIEVLSSAAEFWAGQGKPFFAVFVDPESRLQLPPLFREARNSSCRCPCWSWSTRSSWRCCCWNAPCAPDTGNR